MSFQKVEYVTDEFAIRKLKEGTGTKKLLCFPPAGGNSIAFKKFSTLLTDNWSVWAVDPPGHGLSKGDFIDTMDGLIEFYFRKMQPYFQGQFYLLGHSLGGLVAFKLAQRLIKSGISTSLLIICATQPPHRIKRDKPFANMNVKELIDQLQVMNGIPNTLLEHPRFLDIYIPSLQADFKVYEAFGDHNDQGTYEGKTWIVGGTDDKLAKMEQINEWNTYCVNCNIYESSGDHFFVQSNGLYLAELLNEHT